MSTKYLEQQYRIERRHFWQDVFCAAIRNTHTAENAGTLADEALKLWETRWVVDQETS